MITWILVKAGAQTIPAVVSGAGEILSVLGAVTVALMSAGKRRMNGRGCYRLLHIAAYSWMAGASLLVLAFVLYATH